MSLLRRGARRVASSPRLARALLGIEVPPIGPGRRYFDVTTIVLIRAVAPRVDRSSRVLDMGTGAFAAIGLALRKRTGCTVVSSDVDADLVKQARANVALNEAPIEVVQARFFDGVFNQPAVGRDGRASTLSVEDGEGLAAAAHGFDCVTFNAPYVPTGRVGADGGVGRYAAQSDGGALGTEIIEGFLEAFESEARVRRAYLGVNTTMVPRRASEASIAARAGLRLREIVSPSLLPVDIYVIDRAARRSTANPTQAPGRSPGTESRR